MKYLAILAALDLLFCVSAFSQGGQWAELYEPQVFEGMTVRVMKPLGFDESKQYPVILSLHGAGGKGTDNK